ncbi:hypothetical protein ABZ797_43350, partial [Streptomyces antimycoticus]|uniref:hypothetical protein n=1 Tax=Streptomyces antimycoticus TaxID=68175 RepID=UPI0033DE3C80
MLRAAPAHHRGDPAGVRTQSGRPGETTFRFAGNTSGSVYRILTHLAAEAVPGTRLVGILP